MFYYFESYRKLPKHESDIVFAVPSGNFGNLTAGLFAKKMGLPVTKFIAATNINDVVPQYLTSSVYSPRPSKETLSNAMDVGSPSNFARILDLYGSTWNHITSHVFGASFKDEQTLTAIKEVQTNYQYLLDPHGSVAYLGAKEYLRSNPNSQTIILETAHPSKFQSVMENALKSKIPIHPILANLQNRPSSKTKLPFSYPLFKDYLFDKFHI